MKGGYREGAGRKKGFAAIEAENARAYIAERVSASLEPIIDGLIESAKKGDIHATKELFDRAWGRAQAQIALSDDRSPTPIMQLEPAESFQRNLVKVYNTPVPAANELTVPA